jgi:hypothetical protein
MWLPGRKRIEFKLAVLMCMSLQGTALSYLSEDCLRVEHAGRRRFGDRSFEVERARI